MTRFRGAVKIADLQPDIVPIFGQARVVQAVNQAEQILYA